MTSENIKQTFIEIREKEINRTSSYRRSLKYFVLLDKIQGGSDKWVWQVKLHIFGICQDVFLGIKIEMFFFSNLGGGVRASLTFVKLFFFFEGFPQ